MRVEFVSEIIRHVLTSIYQVFGVSLALAVLFMFAWLYCRESGAREGVRRWIGRFRADRHFRLVFALALYTAMILCKTLFCRSVWEEPLRDVIGVWGVHTREGALYTENIENLALFMPFTFLLLCAYGDRAPGGRAGTLRRFLRSAAAALGLSVGIELGQLFFKVGAIQLSDVAFNTLGGIAGSAAYWAIFGRRRA